jgi:Co/Zn/Cd efflux system component
VIADAAVSVLAIAGLVLARAFGWLWMDPHVWRVGTGHMSALVSVTTREAHRDSCFYHALLKRFDGLSHVTVEVNPPEAII